MRRRSWRRRTWPQRLVLGFNTVVVVACFAGATLVATASNRIDDRRVVTIDRTADTALVDPAVPTTVVPGAELDQDAALPPSADPLPDLPVVDPDAQNWLITGVDNGDCVADGQVADADIGDRSALGERTDTIMVVRVDPSSNQAAVLSFPRDLWVRIGTSSREGRINTAWRGEDPSRLVVTIEQTFGIAIDHLLSVDFCAFKAIVDAVGGVRVSFDSAVRDPGTGFTVPGPGCYLLGPDEALDYVRSRKYQVLGSDGTWTTDPTADLGRISRQQDFLRRAVQRAFDRGISDPRVAWSLLNAAIDYVVTDDGTNPQAILALGQAMRDLDPDAIGTYTVEWRATEIGGNAVLEPRLRSDSMQQILALFRGEARLGTTVEQVAATDTPATTPDSNPSSAPTTTAAQADPDETATTVPSVDPQQTRYGLVPIDDPECR